MEREDAWFVGGGSGDGDLISRRLCPDYARKNSTDYQVSGERCGREFTVNGRSLLNWCGVGKTSAGKRPGARRSRRETRRSASHARWAGSNCRRRRCGLGFIDIDMTRGDAGVFRSSTRTGFRLNEKLRPCRAPVGLSTSGRLLPRPMPSVARFAALSGFTGRSYRLVCCVLPVASSFQPSKPHR